MIAEQLRLGKFVSRRPLVKLVTELVALLVAAVAVLVAVLVAEVTAELAVVVRSELVVWQPASSAPPNRIKAIFFIF